MKSRTMLLKFLNSVLDLKHLFQSKLSKSFSKFYKYSKMFVLVTVTEFDFFFFQFVSRKGLFGCC